MHGFDNNVSACDFKQIIKELKYFVITKFLCAKDVQKSAQLKKTKRGKDGLKFSN